MRTFHPIAPRVALILSAVALGPSIRAVESPDAPRALPGDLCVVVHRGVATAVECESEGDAWFGSTHERAAAGAPVCWWTADAGRFTEIRGVGTATANRIVEFRDAGGMPDRGSLDQIRGIGPRLADAVSRAVTRRCARVLPTRTE